MLYVFHGSDIDSSRTKAHKLINSLRTKKPDATFIKIESDNFNIQELQNHITSQALFASKYIIFLDRVCENPKFRDELIDIYKSIHESDNVFIVLENSLNVETKKILEKYSDKILETSFAKTDTKKSPEFNIFSLADAIGNKDYFKAWSVYRQAIDAGLEVESIIGTIFWQLKSLIQAIGAKSVTESGLSPFVFSKSKKMSVNFTPQEIKKLMNGLLIIYHDGHRGLIDPEIKLESWILNNRSDLGTEVRH
jgi:DNA polymerase III delta subunit